MYVSESLLQDEESRLKVDKTSLWEQCKLEALSCGRIHSVLDGASECNHTFHENILKLRVQYDPELADLQNECDGLQVQLTTYDSRSELSWERLCIAQ